MCVHVSDVTTESTVIPKETTHLHRTGEGAAVTLGGAVSCTPFPSSSLLLFRKRSTFHSGGILDSPHSVRFKWALLRLYSLVELATLQNRKHRVTALSAGASATVIFLWHIVHALFHSKPSLLPQLRTILLWNSQRSLRPEHKYIFVLRFAIADSVPV